MCGILGIVIRTGWQDSGPAGKFPQAMEMLRHRGPDESGQYRDGNVLLGHTRLSILDLSSAASQPMQSPDGRFIMTYNGEVYNFRQLAQEYGLADLRSGSDTEIVLRLFARLGCDAVPLLNGMFAFAVYDTHAQQVWLVRDRLGIKPLYYRLDTNCLTFASEIKGITALDSQVQVCDIASLHEWLYYGNPLAERTLYVGIKQLLPGHYLKIDLNTFEHQIGSYWSLAEQVKNPGMVSGNRRRIVSETRRLLEQAVQRQLVSDVPVGVFLSGGVDSSAIAAFAARYYGGRLATYSAGFDFARDGGELPRAKRVAARYGTEHHEIHISGAAVGDLVEKLVYHHDLPFSDAANIPLYLLASRIGGHTKVVLQGDGGDELFGGYRRYFTLSYYHLLRPLARALRHLQDLAPRSALQYRVRRYLQAFAAADMATTMALLLTPEDRSLAPTAIFANPLRREVERFDPFLRHRECQRLFANQDAANQMSFVDMMITLPDTFLAKVDRSTMAASVEVRVPFLDHDLLDFIVQLPGRSKIPWGKKKWLLKSALEGIVPAEVLHGPKIGLEVPVAKWLQGPLQSLFLDHLASFARRYPDVLDTAYVRGLLTAVDPARRDDSSMLWKVLNFMIWANRSKVDIHSGALS